MYYANKYRNGADPKPEKVIKVKKKYVYKRKPTGERELFLFIWATRKHVCVNCGVGLGKEPKVGYFSHEKSKGAHPELRLDESNIKLRCLPCHSAFDKATKEQYEKLGKLKTNKIHK
jgi:hypothetical protein